MELHKYAIIHSMFVVVILCKAANCHSIVSYIAGKFLHERLTTNCLSLFTFFLDKAPSNIVLLCFKGMNYCYFSCLLTWYGQTINKREKMGRRKKEGNFNLLPSVQSLISLRNIFRGFFVAASGKFMADKVFFVINISKKNVLQVYQNWFK